MILKECTGDGEGKGVDCLVDSWKGKVTAISPAKFGLCVAGALAWSRDGYSPLTGTGGGDPMIVTQE
jgi:hypothetical protein